MQVGYKVRIIANEFSGHGFDTGVKAVVEFVDATDCRCVAGESGWWVDYRDLELIENNEYLKMRGIDVDESVYNELRESPDPMFPDENTSIRRTFLSLHDLLQFKNKRYGNSSLEPIKVLSKADNTTGLLQRADDKIARIKNSPELRKNDVADLIGYLVLICVSKGWDNFDEFKD
jgi:hypothetical protein